MDKSIEQMIEDDDIFFCHMPWTMVYSEVEGGWQTCCHGAKQLEMTVENTSPEEWMKSDYQNRLRDEMLDPNSDREWINHVCRRCVKEEKLYGESRRLRKKRHAYNSNPAYREGILRAVEWYKRTGEFEFEERILETQVKVFGMECNLDCHMCHPRHSTTRKKTQLTHGGLSEAIYGDKEYVSAYTDMVMKDRSKGMIDKLMDLAEYTYYVKIIGGEPMMMKKQYEYLEKLVESGHAEHIQIKYQTNMTKISLNKHKIVELIPHFKRFDFTMSLDGIGDSIEYARRRTVWSEVLENIRKVKVFPNVVFNINAVLGFLSILRFYELLEWQAENLDQKRGKTGFYALEYPPHFQVKNLPEKIKQDLIPKYEGHPDIQAMLRQPPDEYGTPERLQETFEYLLKGDEYYKGTKWEKNLFEVYPELEEFYNPPEIIAKG